MKWVARVILGIAAIVGSSPAARAQEKPEDPCRGAQADAPAAIDRASEELAFERDMARYARQRAFTERLIAEREARAFEEEQARYERFRALTLRLANEAEQAMEREFDRAVELYLTKVRLTKSLAGDDVSAPRW